MKAIGKIHKKHDNLELFEIDKPKINANEVLIKIKKSSICGTDLHIYEWDQWAQKAISTPLILGHEFYGEIVEKSQNLKNLKIGSLATAECHLSCKKCQACKNNFLHLCYENLAIGITQNGGFAEFVKVPFENIKIIPNYVNKEYASILDPLGNAIHTVYEQSIENKNVLITGAGPVGLFAISILKFLGAKNIYVIDLNEYRLQLAKDLGATKVLKFNEKIYDYNISFEVALEMSGNQDALNYIIEKIDSGGNISILGIYKDEIKTNINNIVFKGLKIKGIYGRKYFDTWGKMFDLLEKGLKIDKIITHNFQYYDFEKAFQKMKSRNCGKVILNWDNFNE